MPLAARRMGRPGVIGPRPVARTAATVGTVAVVAHSVNRRSDRREDRRDDRGDRRDDRKGPSLLSRAARNRTPGMRRVGLERSRRLLNGVGDLHARSIVRGRGHEIGWPVPVASAGGRVSHPPVDSPVLAVGRAHRALPQRAQPPSISCCCHDSHRCRADHPRATRILGRRSGSQVDHQGLHDEACPGGHLVHAHSRGYPRSGRGRQCSE
jgi:hypothetical protein